MQRPPELEPLPYHREIVAYLQREEQDLWYWFSSNRVQKEQAEAVRLELLKTTYRIEAEQAPLLHELAHRVSERLGIDGPITFYQSQGTGGLNAALAFLPDETHIVLQGPITETLAEKELESLLGHELSHRILWTREDGRFLSADQILTAMANDPAAAPAPCESARLFRLYTEIFCDRGALVACGELSPVVAALVKTETGLKEISGESYLRQADEIFSKGETKTDRMTHPECFIRVRALQLWQAQETGAEDEIRRMKADRLEAYPTDRLEAYPTDRLEAYPTSQETGAEEEIRRMLEGAASLSGMNLLGQLKVAKLTRRLIDQLLSEAWMQTATVLGHARLFFDDYQPPPTPTADESLAADLQTADDPLRDYYCYVLLDFATTDRDLEDAPLAAALLLAERVGLSERFEPIVRKELELRKKQWEKLRGDAAEIVARAGNAVNDIHP